MADVCTIIIEDECNIKLSGLDLATRKACNKAVEYFLPGARYSSAYKLGRWNGMQSFCNMGGRTYLNLLDKFLPIIQDAGYEIEIDDHRELHDFKFDPIDEKFLSHLTWPAGHRAEGQPIMMRDYQVKIVNDCINNLQGLSIASTSAGKTLCTVSLSMMAQKYGRSIVIVPNINLVQQTEEDFRNVGLDVGVLYGNRKEYDRTHTICTWQSLSVLDKKSKDCLDDDQLAVFMDGLVAVIVDEAHGVKDLNVLHTMLTTTFAHIPIRWGLTGTLPEEDFKQMGLISAVGPVVGVVTAKELQDAGYIANCDITMLQTQETAKHGNYQEELKYLVTNEKRLEWLANQVTDIAKNGNTVVLVDRIPTGRALEAMLPGSIFISGDMKADKRREHYKEINLDDNKILIATYGCLSTGISINRIFNLVLVEAGKSFTRVIQSIGRGLRKADDKDSVNVFDVSSSCKYSKKHMLKRKEFYKSAQYPFKLEKVHY